MTTDDEKRKAIKAAINLRQVQMGNEYKRPVSVAEMADYLGISYQTLVQIANGLRLPAWENMVKIGRRWPEILQIMEVPLFVPDVPGADIVMQNYEKMTPAKRQKLIAFMQALMEEGEPASNHTAPASV